VLNIPDSFSSSFWIIINVYQNELENESGIFSTELLSGKIELWTGETCMAAL
jgi:hypothetical protein